MKEIDGVYYRLGLAKAKNGDLSEAICYARISLGFNPENERAKKLLEICLRETGDTNCFKTRQDVEKGPSDALKSLKSIMERFEGQNALARVLTRLRAMSVINVIAEDSVRDLNIKACACALIGDYKKAARFFAKALWRDKGNRLAFKGLRQVCERL